MAMIGFLLFTGAFAITLAVLIGTLIPALSRIIELLAGAAEPQRAPRLVLTNRRHAIRAHPAARVSPHLCEAA